MKKKSNKALPIIYEFVSIIFGFAMAGFGWIGVIFDGFSVGDFLAAIIGTIVMVVFGFLTWSSSRGYKIKHIFAKKKFNKQIVEALIKFNLPNAKFAQVFKKSRKPIFYQTGNIFLKETFFGEVYRNKKIKNKVLILYSELLKNIKNGEGFVGFIKDVEKMNFDSGWQINYFMCNDSISKELQYIICEVFLMTDFCLTCNQFDLERKEKIDSDINVLNNIFSPILFNFESELECVLKRAIKEGETTNV